MVPRGIIVFAAFDADGRHRWDAALGGFAFDLCCADLDGDGVDEILTAGADGVVGCFSASGQVRWRHTLPAPVQQVSVARLGGQLPVVLAGGILRQITVFSPGGQVMRTVDTKHGLGDAAIRMLRAGDFDGDGRDEVALQGLRGRPMETCFLKGIELTPLAGATVKTGLKTANGMVADVDGDRAQELLIGDGIYALQAGDNTAVRRIALLPGVPPARSYDYQYRMRSLAAGNLLGDGGTTIVTLDGPDLQVCTAQGELLESVHAPLSFTDIVCVPGQPHDAILLGSGTGGDDNLYRVTLNGDWKRQLESLPRSGRLQAVEKSLGSIAEVSAKWEGAPMTGAAGPFDVVVNHHLWAPRATLTKLDDWIDEVRFFEQQFPYARLRFSTCFWPGEQLPLTRPDGKPWNVDQRLSHDLTRTEIAGIARKFEQAKCHFWVQVGHGCSPHLSVESVAAILDAAPEMCLGFVSAEDQQLDETAYYYEHHVRPILELCLIHGKRFLPRNKNVWWCHWPADPGLRQTIFSGRYRSVLVPCVEDSNCRTTDADLAARVGMWLDGQVDDWASRCSADWFSFNRAWEWESVMTGHPHLRYYVSQALLGSRVFMMLNGDRERTSGRWTRVGTEGIAPFLHMLGRGLITPPTREQMKAISSVALNMQGSSERFAQHGFNNHNYQTWNGDGSENQPWAFDRLDCYWGMAPLPHTDVSTYLWGRTQRSAEHIPVSGPHGFVCIVPGRSPSGNGPWATIWTTDGDMLSKDGTAFTLEAAREAIRVDLETGMKTLPFRVEGKVFCQIVAQEDGRYAICLMDPGWVDPANRSVVVYSQTAGTWVANDRLTGQTLGTVGTGLSVDVPAGVFRILDLTRKQK